MTQTQPLQDGVMGSEELAAYVAQVTQQFMGAKVRKPKRPRGLYELLLKQLVTDPTIAFIVLPSSMTASATALQQSFDQNATKIGLNCNDFGVYVHEANKSRLLVNWAHPHVEQQFNKWVLANTKVTDRTISAAATASDKAIKAA